ncbi:MAG: hypothetical protein IT252_02710 [Chitinophagaceae bacterium]|nr:hypothetical protein [Chitinophagaceae bacterium]
MAKKIKIKVGFGEVEFVVMPKKEVRRMEDAIQKRVQPELNRLKRVRKKAEAQLGKVVLNA